MRRENFALYHYKTLLHADPCCRSVVKQFAHAFSCVYIQLWMHLGSLESTQTARVAFGCVELLLRIFRALQTSRVHPGLDLRTLSMNKVLIIQTCAFGQNNRVRSK